MEDDPQSVLRNRANRETTIDETSQHPEVVHLIDSLVQESFRRQALCESNRFIARSGIIEDGVAESGENGVSLLIEKDVLADQISVNAAILVKIAQGSNELRNDVFHMRLVEMTKGLQHGEEIASRTEVC